MTAHKLSVESLGKDNPQVACTILKTQRFVDSK
jgi:hypothetical protein